MLKGAGRASGWISTCHGSTPEVRIGLGGVVSRPRHHRRCTPAHRTSLGSSVRRVVDLITKLTRRHRSTLPYVLRRGRCGGSRHQHRSPPMRHDQCRSRSVDTMRKYRVDVLTGIPSAITGNPWRPPSPPQPDRRAQPTYPPRRPPEHGGIPVRPRPGPGLTAAAARPQAWSGCALGAKLAGQCHGGVIRRLSLTLVS